jgi:hypothetical protein
MKPKVKHVKKPNGGVQAVLSGELTLKYHRDIVEIFNTLDATIEAVELLLDRPSGIDLSFLQILAAFQAERKRQGKSLSVSAFLLEADGKLIARTGFSPLMNK